MDSGFEICQQIQGYFESVDSIVDDIIEQIHKCLENVTDDKVKQLLQALETNINSWYKNEQEDAYHAFESVSEWFPDPDYTDAEAKWDADWDRGWEAYSRDDS